MTGKAGSCRLPDGRRLGYAEFGAPHGRPVLYCHGFPGSRLEARLAQDAAATLGVRLIAPDRPGFGTSDPAPERRLTDWPADLAALADHLGIERFHLIGVSGGGPYALACAAALEPRLEAVAVVCGLGELAAHASYAGMAWPIREALQFTRQLPQIADWVYGHLAGPALGAHPEMLFRIMSGGLPPVDQEVLDDPEVHAAILASYAEVFRQGSAGAVQELHIYTHPWNVTLTAIRVPVQLWHGEADTIVPVAMGRYHAAVVPGCRASFLPGEGHFSLVVRHMSAILRQLVGA